MTALTPQQRIVLNSATSPLTRLGPGRYRGSGLAYGFTITNYGRIVEDDEGGWGGWRIEADLDPEAPEKRAYAEWLLENFLGLGDRHKTLRDARADLRWALREDLLDMVGDIEVRPSRGAALDGPSTPAMNEEQHDA